MPPSPPPQPAPPSLQEIHQQISAYLAASTSASSSTTAVDPAPNSDEPPSPTPPIARPSLISLPTELLKAIIHFCDLPSALSLARVCRRISPLTEERIWRTLNPYTPPLDVEKSAKHSASHWARDRKKIAAIFCHADRRRWDMVEAVNVQWSEGNHSRIAILLDEVSANLKALTFYVGETAITRSKANMEIPLELRLLQYDAESKRCGLGLRFPCLTRIHIGDGIIDHIGFIPLLCSWAPNLTSLDFMLSGNGDSTAAFPSTFITKTRLRSLAFGQTIPGKYNASLDGQVFGIIMDLLQNSPQIQSLTVKCLGVDQSIITSLMGQISQMGKLEDLDWPTGSMGFFHVDDLEDWEQDSSASYEDNGAVLRVGDAGRIFPKELSGEEEESEAEFSGSEDDSDSEDESEEEGQAEDVEEMEVAPMLLTLRRLMIYYNNWAAPAMYLGHLPNSPNLDLLCFFCSTTEPIYISGGSSSLSIPPGFATWLRDTPTLDDIRFLVSGILSSASSWTASHCLDDIMQLGPGTGTVQSLCFGDEELIHVRLSVQDIDVTDMRFYSGKRVQRKRFIRSSGIDTVLEKMDGLIKKHEPSWQDWTDFAGAAVPLEVLRRMREVEGASEKDWEKRGVEVGEEAWQVLLDWREGLLVM